MAIDTTAANAVTKEYYGEHGVPNAAYEENPAFGMIQKKRITGKYYDYPVQYGYAQNRSRTASTALAKTYAQQYEEFNVPTVADFNAATIEKKALEEVRDDGAFLDLLTNSVDSVIKALGNNFGSDVFGNRGAARGQVGSISTTTLTLKNPEDVVKFEKNMELRSSEADGLTGSLQSGSATITAIDRDAGTLTSDSNWTAQIASLDADDYLFADGDFGIGRAGFADWCPESTSGLGTAFYGATRDNDATRLAGIRIDGSSQPIRHVLRELCARGGREGVSFDTAFMSFQTLNDLQTELDNKAYVEYTAKASSDATIGFDGIKIIGGNSKLKCVADRSAPDDKIYACKLDEVCIIHSQDSPVKVDDRDGNILSRESSSFGYDIRGASFGNMAVKKPSCVGVAHSLS